MPKLNGYPTGTLPLPAVLEQLRMGEQMFYRSGLSSLLHWYQIGQTKLYKKIEVAGVAYWLMVRRGRIALGDIPRNHPLLPPGEDATDRWRYLDAWLDEDPYDAGCPQCEGPAVQDQEGSVWCSTCGVLEVV